MSINHSHIIRLEESTGLPAFDDRKYILKHLEDVIHEFGQEPYQQNIRHLTVAYQFQQINPDYAENRCVPRISLMGNWVQRAGFEIGSSIRVIVLNKLLVVCLNEQFIKQAA